MPQIAIIFLLGTVSIQWFHGLFPVWLIFIIWITFAILTAVAYKKSAHLFSHLKLFSTLALVFFTGVLLASLSAQALLDKRLPDSLEGKEILVQGSVVGLPEVREDGIRFRLQISRILLPSGSKQFDVPDNYKGLIRLGWYKNRQHVYSGEQWQLKVKLKKPSGFLNPGGFDYEKWLFSQRISATGYVRDSKANENRKLASAPWWSADKLRQKIHQHIQAQVENKASAAVISALVVADRSALNSEQWKKLQETGTSHLIAISGLHIAVVAGFGFLPIWLLWRLFPRLNERLPLQVAGGLAGALFAIGYAVLAGFTLPTQRALIMVLIVLVSLLSRRNFSAFNVLAMALVAVLLLDPLAALSISFWLSFAAVSLILLLIKRQIKAPRWKLYKLQILLSIGMMPLTLLFFDTASLSAPIANLFAIPWVSFIVVPLSLSGLLLMLFSSQLSDLVLNLSAYTIDILFNGLSYISDLVYNPFNLSGIPPAYLFLAIIGFLVFLLPKGFPGRWLGTLAFLPVFFFTPGKLQPGEFHFTLLDIGQGMASVVQTKNHTLIYDVGTHLSDRFDISKLVVLPYLKEKQLSHIDTLVLSHDDIDHIGSANTLLKSVRVKEILASKITRLDNRKYKFCYAGVKWHWDGVDFEVLSPSKNDIKNSAMISDNNLSCVIRVANKTHSLLLTGDIEEKVEKQLSKRYSEKLATTVMIVPHHGSETSSSELFLNTVSAELALLPRGYRNRFKHPRASIIKRYKKHNIKLMDTVFEGAISITFPAERPFSVESYRKQNQHFWSR